MKDIQERLAELKTEYIGLLQDKLKDYSTYQLQKAGINSRVYGLLMNGNPYKINIETLNRILNKIIDI